jgi:hypothetical protein
MAALESAMNRPLTREEYELARWMLEHGAAEAKGFLGPLEQAEVAPWRCPCGCASITFQIKGHPPAPPGVRVLGDYIAGGTGSESGAFIFESGGMLSGIEVYGLSGEAPKVLPTVDELRPWLPDAEPNNRLPPRAPSGESP